jgi:NAD(P)-dependent dehydrogenase (short-subunit alcohol dehydrogenase family)
MHLARRCIVALDVRADGHVNCWRASPYPSLAPRVEDSTAAAMAQILARWSLDGVVFHNARVLASYSPAHQVSLDVSNGPLAVNLTGSFRGRKSLSPRGQDRARLL